MNEDFENILFISTLIIYFILNLTNTVLMITRKKVGLKLIFALLPFPIVIPIMFASVQILKAAVDFDKLPVGKDYGGYGTGLAVLLGLVMIIFYAVNVIYLIIVAIKKNIRSES